MTQTPVEWIIDQIQNHVHHTIRIPGEYVERAKQMEKEQKETLYTKEELALAMLQISEFIIEAVDLDATQSDELEPFVKAQSKTIIKSLKQK